MFPACGASIPPLRKGTFQEIKIGLEANGRPQQRIDQVLKGTRADLVLIQDSHRDGRIKYAFSSTVGGLVGEGFNLYLVEAPVSVQGVFDRVNNGEFVNLYDYHDFIGPMQFGRRSCADAIYTMSDIGFRVVAVDHPDVFKLERLDEKSFKETRETAISVNIMREINNGGRPICLIGSFHAQLRNIWPDVASTAQRLINHGCKIASIKFEVAGPPENDWSQTLFNRQLRLFVGGKLPYLT